jgi:hypothetical protein
MATLADIQKDLPTWLDDVIEQCLLAGDRHRSPPEV